jgi:NAD+ synthetase
MKVALAQSNPVIGDIPGNADKARECIASAEAVGVALVVFSELSIVGYPARDMLEDPEFIAENIAAVEEIAKDCRDVASLVGFVRPAPAGPGAPLQDVAALLAQGRIQDVHVKSLLPNYAAYDDPRYFRPGPGPTCSVVNGWRFGVTICEDLWDTTALGRQLYDRDPVGQLMADGVETIVNIAASGYERGKIGRREALLSRQARRSGAVILYVNQVGGNDGMIFDGSSCVHSPTGELLARAASFKEDLLVVDTGGPPGRCEPLGDEWTRLSEALKLGLRDYVVKGGFPGVVLGLAGDLGSAVVAVLAADALGPENVRALIMPRGQSEDLALQHCLQLTDNLRIRPELLRIEPVLQAARAVLQGTPGAPTGDFATAEIPACLRATLLSILGTAGDRLPLVPVNKTDLALGRCAPAFSVCGALAPIGDVFRSDIARLAERLNAGEERIPVEMLATWRKPFESRFRSDDDVVRLDERLDEILSRHVEHGHTAGQIAAEGFDAETVRRGVRQVARAEQFRRQAPTVLEVSTRAFGPGRRMPVARGYA